MSRSARCPRLWVAALWLLAFCNDAHARCFSGSKSVQTAIIPVNASLSSVTKTILTSLDELESKTPCQRKAYHGLIFACDGLDLEHLGYSSWKHLTPETYHTVYSIRLTSCEYEHTEHMLPYQCRPLFGTDEIVSEQVVKACHVSISKQSNIWQTYQQIKSSTGVVCSAVQAARNRDDNDSLLRKFFGELGSMPEALEAYRSELRDTFREAEDRVNGIVKDIRVDLNAARGELDRDFITIKDGMERIKAILASLQQNATGATIEVGFHRDAIQSLTHEVGTMLRDFRVNADIMTNDAVQNLLAVTSGIGFANNATANLVDLVALVDIGIGTSLRRVEVLNSNMSESLAQQQGLRKEVDKTQDSLRVVLVSAEKIGKITDDLLGPIERLSSWFSFGFWLKSVGLMFLLFFFLANLINLCHTLPFKTLALLLLFCAITIVIVPSFQFAISSSFVETAMDGASGVVAPFTPSFSVQEA